MKLKRLDNWRGRLAAELDRQRRDPFVWGKHDCATGLAASVVEAITGKDLAEEYRDKYKTERGALGVLKRLGSSGLGDLISNMLPEISPALANIGDIGIVKSDGRIGEGICIFDSSGLIVLTPEGHGRLPRSEAVRAFKVGE